MPPFNGAFPDYHGINRAVRSEGERKAVGRGAFSGLNEFWSRAIDPWYKIRTSTRRLSSKLLKVKNGSPAWIRTTELDRILKSHNLLILKSH